MTKFCPHCGYDIVKDEPVTSGPLHFDMYGRVTYAGRPLRLILSERVVLGTLLKADGRTVSAAVLNERLGYEGLNRIVDVYLCRIRKKLRAAGAEREHIVTEFGRGWRWAV